MFYFQLVLLLLTIFVPLLIFLVWLTLGDSFGIKLDPFSSFFISNSKSYFIRVLTGLGPLALIIVIHELIHAFSFPLGTGRTFIVIKSIWVQGYHDGVVSKVRYLFVIVSPFLFLTIFPLSLSTLFKSIFQELAYISLMNSFLCGGDLLSLYLTYTKIPPNAKIRTKGMVTYYSI